MGALLRWTSGVWIYIGYLTLLCFSPSKGIQPVDTTLEENQSLGLPRYRPRFNRSLQGQPFQFSDQYLASHGLPPTRFAELTGTVIQGFVLVTGASSDHFEESIDSIASVQEFFPNKKFLYFDLGLSKNQVNVLLADGGGTAARVFCNVEYRKFHFDRYPAHVKNLYVYSWKFLIIKELLQEFDGVFWFDSSIRFKSGNFGWELEKLIEKSRGIALFTNTGHSNFAVTHEALYNYFPTDIEAQKRTEQWEGGNLIVYNTKEAYYNVLKWMYYCVLEPGCISPTPMKKRGCSFKKDRFSESAGCHRYDQATLNLLLANWYDFNTDMYTFKKRKINQVVRFPSKFHTIRWCDPLPHVNVDTKNKPAKTVNFLPRTDL